MSEGTIIAIVAAFFSAIPPTIAAMAAYRQAKRNEEKTAENTVITEATNAKADRLIKAVDIVHEQTNGNLTAVRHELTEMQVNLTNANKQIAALQALVKSFVDRDTRNGSGES